MNIIERSYRILDDIVRKEAYSNIELNRALKLTDEEDKGAVTRIVYGVLENSVKYDYIINKLVDKRPKPAIIILLKVGFYLLFEMRSVKNYAAINECVEISKTVSKGGLSKFVNAVLRRASEFKLDLSNEDELTKMSVELSIPKIIVEKTIKEYGEKTAKEILTKSKDYSVNIRVNLVRYSLKSFINLLEKNEIEYEKTVLPNAFKVQYLDIMKLPKDSFTTQGLSSMLAVEMLQIEKDSNCLDACAAPGGKSCYIAEKAKNGQVLACELHEHRVRLINSYARRLHIKNVKTMFCDSSKINPNLPKNFDRIICDVPCSGIGVISKKPDIALKFNSNDIAELNKTQTSILEANSRYVASNGLLLYSTCTIFNEENSNIVEKFLTNNSNFEEVDLELPLFYKKKQFGYQLLPNISCADGFYMCLLRRKN